MSPPRPQPEQRFRTLFEQAPFSVQLLSAQGRTLEVNQAWKDLWGTRDGDPLLEWIFTEYNLLTDPQLEANGVMPFLKRAFAGEAARIPATYYDPAALGKPGRARWVEATARPILDAGGQVVEVMLIHEDVTERVFAEKQLRASELRLKQLANAIPQLAWIADAQGSVEWYNDRWYQYTGTSPEDMRGWGWQRVHDPQVLPSVLEAWQRSLATGDPFQMTFPLLGRDGTYRPFFTLVAPMKDDTGRVLHWFGTNTDVSPLHEAERSRREGERRKDEFLAMLAHELRNPLAPIGMAAQLLKFSADPERVVQVGEMIDRQVRHMTKLVDDLLDVSRVTRGLITLDMRALDLGEVIAAAVEQVLPLLHACRHTLTQPRELHGVAMQADRTRLVQVLVNLLNNAAKYSPPGSHIALDAEVTAGRARIVVRDNGQGIDAAFLPHVFELFTQASRTPDRSQGGLGIGLALVKSLVEMHGGEVSAASAGAGHGSSFTIALPLTPAGASVVRPPEAAAAARAAPLPPALRVAVVDDNKDAAEMLATVLRLQGCEVVTAADGQTALDIARTFRPRVYVLDIGLPNMDGYELARRLRADASLAPATLIALTGYGQERDRELSRAAGFDLHLVKPVDPEVLQRAIGDLRA